MDRLERGEFSSLYWLCFTFGAFGTVWGIMNSFASIAESKNGLAGGAEILKPCLLQHLDCWRQYLQWLPVTNFQEIDKIGTSLDVFAQEFTALGRQLDEGGAVVMGMRLNTRR